jgi:polyferredoxin
MKIRRRLFLISVLLAVLITEVGNRTASILLSRASALGWLVATAFWPAGIHEGTISATFGSVIVAYVVNVTVWTVLIYGVGRSFARVQKPHRAAR